MHYFSCHHGMGVVVSSLLGCLAVHVAETVAFDCCTQGEGGHSVLIDGCRYCACPVHLQCNCVIGWRCCFVNAHVK